MEQGKIAQLVDLREPWMFEQDRIWGSVNIPYDELENLMGEIRKDGTIVFYCDRGAKSMVVCRDLWRMGYHAVEHLIENKDTQTAIGMRGAELIYVPMSEAVSTEKKMNEDVYTIAQVLSI